MAPPLAGAAWVGMEPAKALARQQQRAATSMAGDSAEQTGHATSFAANQVRMLGLELADVCPHINCDVFARKQT